jgi:hypothetical protein
MQEDIKIPEDFEEFLYWVKARTEATWAIGPQTDLERIDFAFDEDQKGVTWHKPLTDIQIDTIETKYDLTFPSEYRLFLKILHTPNQKQVIEVYDQEDDHEFSIKKVSLFHDWLNDELRILELRSQQYDSIHEDIRASNAPPLIPISSNRFLVGTECDGLYPVLSAWGSDIVVYGCDLRSYLLRELRYDLGISNNVSSEEGREDDWVCPEYQKILNIEYPEKLNKTAKSIPFWGDFITELKDYD